LKIAITGAGGYIGEYLTEEVLSRGHEVLALARSSLDKNWHNKKKFNLVLIDLLSAVNLDVELQGIDLVIHLAASMSGDKKTQHTHTIQITKNLLDAMNKSNISKLICVSSLSVLDYTLLKPMSTIDERTIINQINDDLGSYALMKRDQEIICQQWQKQENSSLGLVRPGIVYSDKKLSTDHVGFVRKDKCVAVKHSGEVPVVHVKNVVTAIVSLAEKMMQSSNYCTTFHLINDCLPNQKKYIDSLKSIGKLKYVVSIDWRFFSILTSTIRYLFLTFGKKHLIPDSFKRNSVAARFSPFNFDNEETKKLLDWKPISE